MLRTVKIRLLFQRKTANFKQNQMEKKISTAANQESDGEKDFYGSKSHWQQNQSLGAESCAKNEDLEQQKKLTRGILQQQRERDLTGRLQKNSGKDPVGDEPIPRQEIHEDQRAGPGDSGSRFNTRCRDTPYTPSRPGNILKFTTQ
jgi:hypothetical protein